MFNRRDFLKISSAVTGSFLLDASRLPAMLTVSARPTINGTQSGAAPAADYPELILVNGNIITMDARDRCLQGLAIVKDRILKTGTNEEMRALASTATQVIDLHGRTVTPGLIDAHNHLQVWGTMLSMYQKLTPPEVNNLDQLLGKLRQAIRKKKTGEWVLGYFWEINPLPGRETLDPISPDHPVWLMQQGGHIGCCNSQALKIAGITSRTPDPEGGIIQRRMSGEPSGVFFNHRAMDLVRRFAPRPTLQQVKENIHFGEKQMIAAGVTTFHDCNIRFDPLQAYLAEGNAHAMAMRSQLFYTLEWPADLPRALNQIEKISDDFMRFAGYKFLIDGQFPTWYTHQPHPGVSWNMPTWDAQEFKRAVRQLHDTGLQVAVHCCGDAAVDLVLDAYQEAMQANPRTDPRHRLEHAMLCSKEAVQRVADMGVVISCQPQFLHLFKEPEQALGKSRASRLVVTREWLEAGIPLALGSDTPTVPWYKPQMTLYGAMVRKDARGRAFHPEQQLTIKEALRLHTMGSAYAAFEEGRKGSLEAGKFADLAVWSEDPYSLEPAELLEAEIEMTMIGGKIAFKR